MPASPPNQATPPKPWNLRPVDGFWLDAPVGEVLADLAYQAGISIVAPQSDVTVTLELDGADAERSIRSLALLAGMAPVLEDGLLTFEPGQRIEAVEVIESSYYTPTQLQIALESVLPPGTRATSLGDRVVVAGSHQAVARARELAQQVSLGPDAWVLEIYLVGLTRSYAQDLGIGLTGSAGAALALDARTGTFSAASGPITGARASALVEAVATATADARQARVLTHGTLYLLEGLESSLGNGRTVPVPIRVTTPEGTTRTERFEYRETGFRMQARGVRVPGGLLLNLAPTISTIVGDVDGAPITDESTVDAAVVLDSGEWLVLTGLQQAATHYSATGTPWSLGSRSQRGRSEDLLLVCVRAVRVRSSAARSAPLPDDVIRRMQSE